MKGLETDYVLDTLTALVIANYNLDAINMHVDLSTQFQKIVTELKARNVTLSQIEVKIIENDFTHMLTTCGSGNRERSYVMDMIKEYYNND